MTPLDETRPVTPLLSRSAGIQPQTKHFGWFYRLKIRVIGPSQKFCLTVDPGAEV